MHDAKRFSLLQTKHPPWQECIAYTVIYRVPIITRCAFNASSFMPGIKASQRYQYTIGNSIYLI